MSETELIQAIRAEVREALELDRRLTVQTTMKELGYDLKSTKDTISFNQSAKLIGRRTLENAMKAGFDVAEYVPGVVRWYKRDLSNPHCPVRVNRSDVMKIKNSNHC